MVSLRFAPVLFVLLSACFISEERIDEIRNDALEVGDADDDGVAAPDDCDDSDPLVGAPSTFHVDADGDGVGVEGGETVEGCTPPQGFAEPTGDCDDADDANFPGNSEVPEDGLDQDCDGRDAAACFTDLDQDGWGTPTVVVALDGTCDTADGEAFNDDDCADDDATRYPGAPETPGDGTDQNCDGADSPPCYDDDDADGDGDLSEPIATFDCAGQGGAPTSTDCDDTDGTVYPGAQELCDGQANACGALPAPETDSDGDGFVQCPIDPGGWDGAPQVLGGDDCNGADGTVFPGAGELCDGKINACGGALPANEVDQDDDAFVACTFAPGVNAANWAHAENPLVAGGADCNDAPGGKTIFPGAPEICDGKVNACGGSLPGVEIDDDDDTFVECIFAPGVDDTNWGNLESPAVAEGLDCDDTLQKNHPGAVELCDGMDNNCLSGIADEAQVVTFEPAGGGAMSNVVLQTAVAFNANGTLWFCDGTYHVNVTINTPSAVLRGRNGPGRTILSGANPQSGNPEGRPLTIQTSGTGYTAHIQGVTLGKGLAQGSGNGGAVRIDGNPTTTITDCIIEESSAARGGGIYLGSGALTVSGTIIDGNAATSQGGGIYVAGGTLAIVDGSMVSFNTAAQTGGGLHQAAGTVSINASDILDNTATLSGGGIHVLSGNLAVTDSLIDGNHANGGAGQGGGGIGVVDGTVTLAHSDLTNNEATVNDGGGILVLDTGVVESPIINLGSNSIISGNSALDWGGGIACEAECAITATNSFITANAAGEGGGVFLGDSGAEFHCIASPANAGGVLGNAASDGTTSTSVVVGGGLQLNTNGASATSDGCDWGSGATQNTPSDVGFNAGSKVNYGGDTTFACSYTGCF